jgi:predicted DNA-binding transcriptional regulator AlpA
MGRKLSDGLAYPPRAMRAETAAAYLQFSTSLFFELVNDGTMPPAVKIRSVSRWDRLELDAAFDNLKETRGSESVVNRRIREMRKRNVERHRTK